MSIRSTDVPTLLPGAGSTAPAAAPPLAGDAAQPLASDAADFAQAVQSPPQQATLPGHTEQARQAHPAGNTAGTTGGQFPAAPQLPHAGGEAHTMPHGWNNAVRGGDLPIPASQAGQASPANPASQAEQVNQANQMNQANQANQANPTSQAGPAAPTAPTGAATLPPEFAAAHFSAALRQGPVSGQTAEPAKTTEPAPTLPAEDRGTGANASRADNTGSAKTGKPDRRGDAILHALGGVAVQTADAPLPLVGMLPTGPLGQADAPGLAELSGMDQRVLTQLVDSILVSAQEGKQEVRIKVQDAVLKDTHIVVRMQDGKLEVQLQTTDSYSSQLLHQNVDTLRHALEGQQFGTSVRVQVEDVARAQTAGTDAARVKADGHNVAGQQGQAGQAGQSGHDGQDQRSRGNFLWDREGE